MVGPVRSYVKKATLVMIGIVIVAVAAGCPRQSQKPGVVTPKVTGKEPVITLFINDTGETKKIKMEEYIQGVVAAEMDPKWPDEALAAQAILARSFTMKKIEEGGVKKRGTDASTSVEEFQAYDAKRINDKVRQAVQRTRGELVTYKGRYINGWFFADAGGRTAASAVEGLAFTREKAPYIHSVSDPGFAITVPENKSWTAEFPLEQVRSAVKKITGQDIGPATSAQVVKKGPSGRAMKIQIGNATVGGPALRLALGSEKMRSTLITGIAVSGGKVVIKGKGFGHGVGMSQWGARALAEQGKKAEEIINHFFSSVQIKKVW
ncbi:MAG: SpoIID/LytB domain-containing protein [Bacillota bacterium]